MKNQENNKPNKIQTSPINITTSLVEPVLLKDLVEEIAGLRNDTGFGLQKVPHGSRAIEISSIEAWVSGYIHLSDKDDHIDIPFDSSFLFTCIKGSNRKYDLTWVSSLS